MNFNCLFFYTFSSILIVYSLSIEEYLNQLEIEKIISSSSSSSSSTSPVSFKQPRQQHATKSPLWDSDDFHLVSFFTNNLV